MLSRIVLSVLAIVAFNSQVYAGIENDIGPLDERITHPRNQVARNFGVWDGGVDDRNNDEPQPGNIQTDVLEFRKNGHRGFNYTECGLTKMFHTQHVVRMPNKDGRAYFMVTSSFGYVPDIPLVPADPAGFMSVYRSDNLDPVTDLVPNNSETDGEIVWEHTFDDSSPIGAWNHPCKMELIGSLLLVSAQQWASTLCRDGGGELDEAILFYDVRDPENPKFWGRITLPELHESSGGLVEHPDCDDLINPTCYEVNDVGLFNIGDRWILKTGHAWWWTAEVTPDISKWKLGGTGTDYVTGQHGQHFYSLESYDPPSSAPTGTLSPGAERVMWYDGYEDNGDHDYVSGDEGFLFRPADGSSGRINRPAPNLFKFKNDYDATGIYVSGGVPIIYAPLEEYPDCCGGDVNADKIYQLSHPENVRGPLPSPNIVTNANMHGPGSLRRAMGYGGTVTFDSALNGSTVTVTDGPILAYLADVTIDASALPNGITISGGNATRVFEVTEGRNVTLKNVTIKDGFAQQGAGILNVGGTLVLEDCTIIDNESIGRGGGVLNGVENNDDGHGNFDEFGGSLTLRNCTVAGNIAREGGGICNIGGVLTVEASTISENQSAYRAGGIANLAGVTVEGGSTVARIGEASLVNSTISGNTNDAIVNDGFGVGGGVMPGSNSMVLVHCTVAENASGGIVNTLNTQFPQNNTLSLENTIVANNNINLSGKYSTVGANLFTTSGGTLTSGPPPLVGDAQIGALGDHGGPTATFLPSFDSPAIDAAVTVSGSPSVDQRGVSRPQGPQPDLGAFEVIPPDVALDSSEVTDFSTATGPGYAGPWFGEMATSHDGVDAMQAGATTDADRRSVLRMTVTGPSVLSFWLKISGDRLGFGEPGSSNYIVGERDWEQFTYEIADGSHEFFFEYEKYDPASSSPNGTAWLDQVVVTPRIPPFADATITPLGDPDDRGLAVAWGDYDNDGHPDLYITNSGANKLFHNEGDGSFADATSGPLAGGSSSHGAAWGDYDNDGDLDLWANALLRNDGGGSFVDATSGPLAGYTGSSLSTGWGDYDNDGHLDLYVVNSFGANKLFHNEGGGTFIDVTSGPLGDAGAGTCMAWADYDNDGDLDLYLGNRSQSNKLLRNDGGGTFVDVTSAPMDQTGVWARSVAWGDYDNDGDLDLYLGNEGYETNKLFRNSGDGTFVDATGYVSRGGFSGGAAWGDYDNDGDLDLYLTKSSAPAGNQLLRNDGVVTTCCPPDVFSDAASDALLGPYGGTYGSAWCDYDNDGDLDLYLATFPSAEGDQLLRNDAAAGQHWLQVKLEGTESNRAGIGARVTVVAGGVSQIREISGCSGQSQDSMVASFGLGTATTVDELIVRWPSGIVQQVEIGAADQLIHVVEAKRVPVAWSDLDARWDGSGVEVTWRLTGVLPTPSFEMSRREGASGSFMGVPGEPMERPGGKFAFVDRTAKPGTQYTYRLSAHGAEFTDAREVSIVTRAAGLWLAQNVPNPFNPQTRIRFSVARDTRAELSIYDSRGRHVVTLVDGPVAAGQNEFIWNGRDVANRPVGSGVYYYRLRMEDRVLTKQMLLIK